MLRRSVYLHLSLSFLHTYLSISKYPLSTIPPPPRLPPLMGWPLFRHLRFNDDIDIYSSMFYASRRTVLSHTQHRNFFFSAFLPHFLRKSYATQAAIKYQKEIFHFIPLALASRSSAALLLVLFYTLVNSLSRKGEKWTHSAWTSNIKSYRYILTVLAFS